MLQCGFVRSNFAFAMTGSPALCASLRPALCASRTLHYP
jgi:hypothetical protein